MSLLESLRTTEPKDRIFNRTNEVLVGRFKDEFDSILWYFGRILDLITNCMRLSICQKALRFRETLKIYQSGR